MPITKRWIPYVAGIVFLLLLTSVIVYSVYYYLNTTNTIEEYEVCGEEHCYRTYHIHAVVHILLCGEEVFLPLEEGPLDQVHAHKERNKLHFHDKILIDKETREVLDTKILELGTSLNTFGIPLTKNCIGGYCNGDSCDDGSIGTLSMTVNGMPSTLFEDYVWQNDDIIRVSFGEVES